VKIYHLWQFTKSLNECFTNPTRTGDKSTFGLTTTAPTVGQRNGISPKKRAILKSREHGGIYRLARAKMQYAFYPCPAQRQMQTRGCYACSALQLRGEMRNHSFIINHALLPSKAQHIRAINPIAQNPSVLGSGGKPNLSHGGVEMQCNTLMLRT
jgi:hypothetical protein